MFRNLMMLLAIGVFVSGVSLSIGCTGGPGEIVKGKATNADFAPSNQVDSKGRKVPDGLGVME